MKVIEFIFEFIKRYQFFFFIFSLVILCAPDIIRYRIRGCVDEWAMKLWENRKKYKKEEVKSMSVKKFLMFFIVLLAVIFFIGFSSAEAWNGGHGYWRGHRGGYGHWGGHGYWEGRGYYGHGYRRGFPGPFFGPPVWGPPYRVWTPGCYDWRWDGYYGRYMRYWVPGYWR